MQVLSPDFSRYLSHSIKILPDAQGQNDAHGTCAAELPGICDVNLVSHTMGDGTWPSAWSRGICKRENPTQGAAARAECPTPAAKSAPSSAHSGQNAQGSQWRTRPIALPSRRRHRLLNRGLRFLTPSPFPPHARTCPAQEARAILKPNKDLPSSEVKNTILQ